MQSVRRHCGRGEAEEGGKMSSSHGSGGRIAVFGNGGPPPSAAPPPVRAPAPQDPSAMPSEPELIRLIAESTREVGERSARAPAVLQGLASLGAGRDGSAAVHAESDIHETYMKLADAQLAQRRAAVRLWRARSSDCRRRP
ncbi:MAG: hypothetical protein OXK17_10175 [Thaumarchaeota archaeon]|nr:hypothetical protein [Nitrososphaerota archaeon]